MRELAEMYQSQITEGTEAGPRTGRKGPADHTSKSDQERAALESLELDTTVLSISDSFTEPITLEAFITEKPEEKCSPEVRVKEKSYSVIETKAEVHKKDERRPDEKNKGRKSQAKTAQALGKSDVGRLFEDGEKVCLATSRKTTSGGSKKKPSSRPEVRPGRQEAAGNINVIADQEDIFLPETRHQRHQGLRTYADQCRPGYISN